MRDYDQIRERTAAAADRLGGLDHVIVTAGVLRTGRVIDTDPGDLAETIDVNLTGSLHVARAAHPYLQASRGSLTFFASSSFTRGRPGYIAYSASKAAIVNVMQGLAEEWSDDGIRVNAVSPERTDTPMRRRAFPDESRVGMLTTAARESHAPAGDLLPHRTGLRHQAPRGRGPGRRRRGWGGGRCACGGPTLNRLEYLLASVVLRVLGRLFDWLPKHPDRVVLATARVPTLEGNLAAIHAEIRRREPDREVVLLLEPYSYGLIGKLRYFGRLVRGMAYLRTSGLFVVDNAYLPVHVARHGPATTVVQVWHAVGALKRFGRDAATELREPEFRFLHRHYDYVVCTAEASRAPRGPRRSTSRSIRVLPLGTPRTDFFLDPVAMAEAQARVRRRTRPSSAARVVLYAPTFRGRGAWKRASEALDALALRAALPPTDLLVLKAHPNLDRRPSTAGFDLVIDPVDEINDLLTVTDVL